MEKKYIGYVKEENCYLYACCYVHKYCTVYKKHYISHMKLKVLLS